MLVENRRFKPTPPLMAPPLGWPRSNFAEVFGVIKLESLGYRVFVILFSRFGTVPACDDGQRGSDSHIQ